MFLPDWKPSCPQFIGCTGFVFLGSDLQTSTRNRSFGETRPSQKLRKLKWRQQERRKLFGHIDLNCLVLSKRPSKHLLNGIITLGKFTVYKFVYSWTEHIMIRVQVAFCVFNSSKGFKKGPVILCSLRHKERAKRASFKVFFFTIYFLSSVFNKIFRKLTLLKLIIHKINIGTCRRLFHRDL